MSYRSFTPRGRGRGRTAGAGTAHSDTAVTEVLADAYPPPDPVPQPPGESDVKMENMETTEDPIEGAVPDEEELKKKLRPWERIEDGKIVKLRRKKNKKVINARLRKQIQPKNSVMVLNEMRHNVKFTNMGQDQPGHTLKYAVEVDGKTFVGSGLTKTLAKQNAAEMALKHMMFSKKLGMMDSPMKDATGAVSATKEPRSMSKETTSPAQEKEAGTESQNGEKKPEGNGEGDDEDVIPWSSLASFAMYKLFESWIAGPQALPSSMDTQQQHFASDVQIRNVDTFYTPESEQMFADQIPESSKSTPRHPSKKIPTDPTSKHPVMLIHELRPDLTVKEPMQKGLAPNATFTTEIVIDGTSYYGTGKGKKQSKLDAAKAALVALYGIQYPEGVYS